MRVRRNLIGAAALAMVLVASACGSDEGSSSDTTAGGGAATTAAGGATTAAPGTTAAAPGTTAGGETGACKSGEGTVPPIETGQADGAGKKVGLLFDVTGRGDKSFNDAAAAGLDKAKADYGITGTE